MALAHHKLRSAHGRTRLEPNLHIWNTVMDHRALLESNG
jgi:hypothetical protein